MDFGGGLSIALNVISAVASIIVITMMVFVYVIDRRLMDRVSLRFTLAISIVDFLKAVSILIYIFVDTPGVECVLLAYLIPVFTLLYMFLTICIALNLQLTFVNGLRFNSKWEKWYWCVSIVSAFGIMAVPLAMDQLGFDEDTLYCTYKDSLSPNTQIFIWATYHSWVLAGCFYCTLIVIIVIFNLNRKVTIINRICEPEYYTDEKGKRVNINEKVQKSLKRLIRRM
ncbi:hypothetical protein K502DRAFT_359187 [Neoconidiobolus thromboides FSU 785]|nr:hypothetical protein K502DRAFT_359187 [Neoconidiobolus thromboides FSU 785]